MIQLQLLESQRRWLLFGYHRRKVLPAVRKGTPGVEVPEEQVGKSTCSSRLNGFVCLSLRSPRLSLWLKGCGCNLFVCNNRTEDHP